MMPITRREIEVLLDTPDQRDYVVSAYADLTVQNGFERYADRHLRNQGEEAEAALAEAKARKDLDANLDVIRRAVRDEADPASKGMAVFSSVVRGLRHVVPLGFPVENRLVVDEEPYLLPLLEHWYGEPGYLIALVDSDEAHLFEALHGRPERVHDRTRGDVHDEIQRDKPRFTYKKRFARTNHERLHGMEDDTFLRAVADDLRDHWESGNFAGLILLGQSQVTGPLRGLLPRELGDAVIGEAAQAMTTRPDDIAGAASGIIARWRADRERRLLDELRERWSQKHLVADGPTDVLDALQQGRAAEVVFSAGHEIPGARCGDCGYRFGAPVETCTYCGGRCRRVSAAQDILRMAMCHRVPVTVLHPDPGRDPLGPSGGVSALLRAEANWAPKTDPSRVSETVQGAGEAYNAAR
jgi:protein required for attachment to host cells